MKSFPQATLITMVIALLAMPSMLRASVPKPPERVVYPSAGRTDDDRGNYYVSLLKLALSKADGAFDVEPSTDASAALRAFSRIETGQGVDVIWAPTEIQVEGRLRRVPVLLDKGLLGWRLLVVRQADLETFAAIHSLDQLKGVPAGQLSEWVDTRILRANGMLVQGTSNYESLFNMLATGRFSYLPRSVAEVGGEMRRQAKLGLVIEPHLALHYPLCTYFFVARENVHLGDQIELGLRRAIKDGSFEKLFEQYNEAALRSADLKHREVFDLSNPTLPPELLAPHGECRDAATTGVR